ncbi:unnamed protein product [Camellia sinensis]
MASTSMAATATLMPCRLPSTTTANYPPPCSSLPSLPPLLLSTPAFSTSLKQLSQIDKEEPGRFSILQVQAASSEESSPPVDAGKLFSDLKEKVRSKPGTIPKKRKLETISHGRQIYSNSVWRRGNSCSLAIFHFYRSHQLSASCRSSKAHGVGTAWIYWMVCLPVPSLQDVRTSLRAPRPIPPFISTKARAKFRIDWPNIRIDSI